VLIRRRNIMAKQNLKTLKVCKLCDQSRTAGMQMTKTVGCVNKKPVSGVVCIGSVGKMICGWYEIIKL